jgi:hypothetical protein
MPDFPGSPRHLLLRNDHQLVAMASTSDILTLVSSILLRVSIWVFLRWVSSVKLR